MLEVEVKIKTEIDTLPTKLEAIGFVKGTTVYERDTYFNSESYDLKVNDKALRIREYRNRDSLEQKFVLNFKGVRLDDITMSRAETQFEIPSYEDGERLLTGLNFYPAGYVEKLRVHYVLDEVTCCLDQVTNLGEFLEIEILAHENEYDEKLSRIKEIMDNLGLCMEDSISKSYLSMLQHVGIK